MNYFEDHIGDYAAATAHLTWDEDMAYTRLIRAYYHSEKPIPKAQAYRLARASTPGQRKAVDTVLAEFFTLADDGWHQKRCDAEIAKFHDKAPDRDAKRENERERQRRARDRRKQIFDALRDVGVIPAFDAPMSQLSALLSQHNITLPSQPVTRNVTSPVTRDVTATQEPDTRNQTPDTNLSQSDPTSVGLVGQAFKRAGVNPMTLNLSDPTLKALIDQGATPDEFEGIAREAIAKGIAKPQPWVCTVLQQRRAQAASVKLAAPTKEAKPWDTAV